MVVIGMMSGSSLDGLDIAACRFSLKHRSPFTCSWSLLARRTFPFPKALQSKMESAHGFNALEFTQLDIELGIWVGEKVKSFIKEKNAQPELLAWHGHTIFHYPEKKLTVQIGSGIAVAVISGIDVLTQLRQADVISGGEGAPLAPLVDKYLFPGYSYYLNLGGIGNLSFYDQTSTIRSFDVCPVNQIFNRLAHQQDLNFDKGGLLARKGKIQNKLLQQLDSWSYYKKNYPKSLDNQEITKQVWPIVDRFPGTVPDKLNTYCHHVCHRIYVDIKRAGQAKSGKMLVTGGGTHNTFLIDCLKEKLMPLGITPILPGDDIIDFKESLIMALMGFMWKNGIPNILNEVTGAPAALEAGTFHKGGPESLIK